MQGNPYIDIDSSISQGKVVLTLKKSWFYYLDIFGTVFFLFAFAIGPIVFGYECLKNPGAPDKIFGTILFIVAAIAFFGIYRKFVESKLLVIQHLLTKSKTKQLLLEYFKDIEDKYIIETDNCIVVQKHFSYHIKLYTFIIVKGSLYFNIVNQYSNANLPVIVDHIFLKNDLTKIFDRGIVKTSTPKSA